MTVALEETRTFRTPGLPQGSLSAPLLVSSSAAAIRTAEPHVDAPEADVGPPTVSATGRSSVAALTSSNLRSIVMRAREQHGPRRQRWTTRERRAWDELNTRGLTA